MATTLTLAQLMIAVRQRADMLVAGYTPALTGTSYFVTDPELISYINQSYFELYDLLIAAYGDNYYVANPFAIVPDGINFQFALPTDFYKLLGVDLLVNNAQDSALTLKTFNFSDRNRYNLPNYQTLAGVTNLRYRLNGSNLWFIPVPQAGSNIQLWYIPRLVQLAALTDTADGISGWTEYIICDAAIKCMQKEESDVSVLQSQKQALIMRIEAMAENRDANNPPTVADHQTNNYIDAGDPYGGGNSFY